MINRNPIEIQPSRVILSDNNRSEESLIRMLAEDVLGDSSSLRSSE
jgi:hypothetical protein